MDSVNGARQIHATSPAAELEFSKHGELSLAHLERGVQIDSEEVSQTAENSGRATQRMSRTWRSPVADVAFRDAGHGNARHGEVEPASIHGTGGVVITGESQRGKAAPVPSRLAADELTGQFGPNSTLTAMTGAGHAGIEETTAAGATETATGDRLTASFDMHGPAGAGAAGLRNSEAAGAAQIQSAVLDGHVVLVQQPAAKPGEQMEPPMRATAAMPCMRARGSGCA